MDSKVPHSTAEVQWERDEIDKKVQCERDAMDKKLREERAAVDLMMNQEHEKMDRAFKQEREKMEKQFKKIHKEMILKLQQERVAMDNAIELERAKMDCKIMQERADMDQKLQQEREDMKSKAVLEQVHMEAKIMQDQARIVPKATTNEIGFNVPPAEQADTDVGYVIAMDFTVYKDGELFDVPNGYYEKIPGSMRIIEPGKVEWWLMVQELAHHDYKGNADVYYIESGCVPPIGMVLMEGPEHVEQMMQALKGRKTCELYIIRNGPPSVDSYDYDGMIEEDQINEAAWGEDTDREDWDMAEHGSSARTAT